MNDPARRRHQSAMGHGPARETSPRSLSPWTHRRGARPSQRAAAPTNTLTVFFLAAALACSGCDPSVRSSTAGAEDAGTTDTGAGGTTTPGTSAGGSTLPTTSTGATTATSGTTTETSAGGGGSGAGGGSGGAGNAAGAGGAPSKSLPGVPCQVDVECVSGFCIDGVCCDTGCTGLCKTCKLPGLEGYCTAIEAGTDPDDECPGQSSVCGALPCNPVVQCVGTLPQGAPCAASTECASAQCVDGVCCDSACAGVCRSCALPGSAGTCAVVPAGSSDAPLCPAPATCDAEGYCEGSELGRACPLNIGGPIELCADGHPCIDGVCCESECLAACAQCNLPGSAGACAPTPCGHIDHWPVNDYLGCGIPNACSDDCAECNGKKGCINAQGTFCTNDVQCQSGHCADNYCCEEACEGPCRRCDSDLFKGECLPIPNGTDHPYCGDGFCVDGECFSPPPGP